MAYQLLSDFEPELDSGVAEGSESELQGLNDLFLRIGTDGYFRGTGSSGGEGPRP